MADGEAGKAVCAAAQLPTAVQWCGSARGGDSACVAQCLAAAQSCAAASSAAGRGGPDATAAHTTCCSQVRTAVEGLRRPSRAQALHRLPGFQQCGVAGGAYARYSGPAQEIQQGLHARSRSTHQPLAEAGSRGTVVERPVSKGARLRGEGVVEQHSYQLLLKSLHLHRQRESRQRCSISSGLAWLG